MKHNKLLLVAVLAFLACGSADAQGILGRLKDRAKNAVENAVGNKIENAINGAIDNAGKSSGNDSDADDDQRRTSSKKASADEPDFEDDSTINGEESDFVPGSVVLFEDNLSGEKIGEFPSKWDIYDGSVGVNKMGDRNVIKFDKAGGTIGPLMKEQYTYLPDEFTLEFDIFIAKKSPDNGQVTFELGLMSNEPNINTWNRYCAFVTFWYRADDAAREIQYECRKPGEDQVRGSAYNSDLKLNAFNHVAVAFNKRSFKFYLNGARVINVPNMIAPKYFQLNCNPDGYPYPVVSNVRLATQGAELYDRNTTDLSAAEKAIKETGKFVTNNILFETGKATLKSESMADIQMVADYMKKNPTVRFEVQGHCDNQGSDAVNDPLSQQRAEAIVSELVKLGCDEFNLRAVGKGSHEPVADNNTEEGRAKNRRVEFVKK